MSHKFYDTSGLSLEEKLAILDGAKEKADRWWVDILDCSVSIRRQKIEMSYEEIKNKLANDSHFVIIHRNNSPVEDHLEIGFSTMGAEPNYYLWIYLDVKYIPEFTENLKEL